MGKRHYDNWLKSFVEYAAFGEAPLKMLFWTGVSTIAGALRRRVWIDQKYFQWLPNFYIILVAPPGIVSKSTTANIGMNLLRGVEGVKFGPDVITWQALITSLDKAGESIPDPRFAAGKDIASQLANPGGMYPMSAVTFCSDELGNLLNPSDRDLVDALVTLWDGKKGTFKKETKTSGSDSIENPWVNIIGCTTPAWISGNFPEYMIGGGFTSRCVFIYADRKRQEVPYVDEAVPPDFDGFGKKLIEDLTQIAQLFGEFTIDKEARIWGREWYSSHWKNPPPNLTGDQFSGYLARKQTHLHKLAMVLSASDSDSLVIGRHHLEAAYQMTSAIEQDMPKVFSKIGQTEITRGSFEIVSLVESYPGISQSDLFRKLFRTLSYKDFVEALNGAINSRQIRSHQKENEQGYFSTRKQEGDDERKAS